MTAPYDPDAAPHRQQSMILVPRDTPRLEIVRHLPIFGYQDQHGHSELVIDGVRVAAANLLAGEGDGFMIAQARLGPGRIHHAMRAIGMAERALALMVERSKNRVAFGAPLADQGVVQELIARSRIEIEQARLLVLKTAWLIDRHGAKGARTEIAAIKVAAPAVATAVIDRAIEVFGAAGVSDDFPLAYFTLGPASCASPTDPTRSTGVPSLARNCADHEFGDSPYWAPGLCAGQCRRSSLGAHIVVVSYLSLLEALCGAFVFDAPPLTRTGPPRRAVHRVSRAARQGPLQQCGP